MKKINNIKQLRGVLRDIITTQDCDEINNFNTLYDYSNIKDMSFLWNKIFQKITKKVNWKDIKFPTLDLKNVEIRRDIFKYSLLFKINLINTYNVKDFYGGFEETRNLEKMSLDLSSCKDRSFIFYRSDVKESELLNTQNIQNLLYRFSYTKNLEKISLDLSGREDRGYIFQNSEIKKVELLNTQNIKLFTGRFSETKKLEKINTLYLDNCEEIDNCFEKSNIKEVKLYNTGKVKEWNESFRETNIEEIELDMGYRENCEYMFCENKNLKKINLKNCKKIKNIEGLIRGCENLDYLEMNVSNMENINDFIDGGNNLEYLKLIGIENQKQSKKNIKEEFNKLFFDEDRDIKPIPHIELEKNNNTFSIIGDNNSNIRLEKTKEKEKIINIKKEKIKEKEGKIKSQKEYNLEINL